MGEHAYRMSLSYMEGTDQNRLIPITIETHISILSFISVLGLSVRFASKKTGSSTRNKKGNRRPKHRGIHYQDGEFVQKGTMLITQNKLRCHPGLNVCFNFSLILKMSFKRDY